MDVTKCDRCGEFIECYETENEMICEECYKAEAGSGEERG
jgi:hypothetical protein